MLKRIALISLLAILGFMFVGCGKKSVSPGNLNNVPKSTSVEWPLDRVSYYSDYTSPDEIRIYVIASSVVDSIDNYKQAPLYKVSVMLRSDGKDYTSVVFTDPQDGIGWRYASATILVPVAEDVDAWQNKLKEYQAIYEASKNIERMPPSRRVLPE